MHESGEDGSSSPTSSKDSVGVVTVAPSALSDGDEEGPSPIRRIHARRIESAPANVPRESATGRGRVHRDGAALAL